MKLEVNIFKKKERAQRLKDHEGDNATMFEGDGGAVTVDFAGYGFTGNTGEPVWIVIVKDND